MFDCWALLVILSFTDLRDRLGFSRVCKAWNEGVMASDWKSLIHDTLFRPSTYKSPSWWIPGLRMCGLPWNAQVYSRINLLETLVGEASLEELVLSCVEDSHLSSSHEVYLRFLKDFIFPCESCRRNCTNIRIPIVHYPSVASQQHQLCKAAEFIMKQQKSVKKTASSMVEYRIRLLGVHGIACGRALSPLDRDFFLEGFIYLSPEEEEDEKKNPENRKVCDVNKANGQLVYVLGVLSPLRTWLEQDFQDKFGKLIPGYFRFKSWSLSSSIEDLLTGSEILSRRPVV